MTSPVIDPQDPENKNIPSSSFNPPSPSLLPSSKSESENTTDLQSRLDSSKEISSLSAVTMNSNERFHLPELTRSNFLDSEGKASYRKEQGPDSYPSIKSSSCNHVYSDTFQPYRSIVSKRRQNLSHCSLDQHSNVWCLQKANTFKAWFKLNHLELRANNIAEFTSEYWNCIATLQSLNEVIEPASLGHALLAKIPASLSHVRDAIIAAGSSSELVVSHETILHLLDSQLSAAIPKAKPQVTHNLPRPSESGEASALLTQKCPQGRHVPSPSHAAENCFSLHPENLTEYRKFMKAKQEAEAHLAMFVPPSMFNVETIDQPDNNFDDLVKSLGHLPANLSSEDSDHESEVSLI
ncbi:hypothetical protein PSTT_09494 [Puccinia striiformis]|uniref:Uncharacterized protein n=1 Tax=Puccinia striiformis TaxID=27350 RepID=A0A2S4V8B6_9BASI|nr:hypothetical protein PSTT_09494 [Puccinia striiformis]